MNEIIKEEGYGILFLEQRRDCSFLKPIFEAKTAVIYEYQKF